MGGGYHGGFGGTSGGGYVAGDAYLMNKTEEFRKYISKRKDVDPGGKFDLIAHGTANEMEVEHNGNKIMINSRTAARMIKSMPGYKEGQPIRLLACNAGARGTGFAQNLANKLGVTVYAPNNYLWAKSDGTHFIAAKNGAGKPDYSKKGKFVKFTPGGNRK